MTKSKSLLATAAFALLAGSVQAQDAPPPPVAIPVPTRAFADGQADPKLATDPFCFWRVLPAARKLAFFATEEPNQAVLAALVEPNGLDSERIARTCGWRTVADARMAGERNARLAVALHAEHRLTTRSGFTTAQLNSAWDGLDADVKAGLAGILNSGDRNLARNAVDAFLKLLDRKSASDQERFTVFTYLVGRAVAPNQSLAVD
ncbi:hypothetical protein [Caulobacter sp. 17J65-9]|uniref:hypothetical protein n=1 Tax=Caulobacter sp. 17J65-9 TaxID=2709382 RepID=UPI0013CC3D79|nr:hypothetical protein [Caulobacter sp. 17J65-9]NEX95000.1 hypothetical protein [Caulobacter sp. 17J65-9]